MLLPVDDAVVFTQALRKVFPPIVTGVTVFLIGAALVGTGFKYWGGGAFCGDNFADGILCGYIYKDNHDGNRQPSAARL